MAGGFAFCERRPCVEYDFFKKRVVERADIDRSRPVGEIAAFFYGLVGLAGDKACVFQEKASSWRQFESCAFFLNEDDSEFAFKGMNMGAKSRLGHEQLLGSLRIVHGS